MSDVRTRMDREFTDAGKGVLESAIVAVATGRHGYPTAAPYSPSQAYPEYPFGDAGTAGEGNDAYSAVRECLQALGLAGARRGTREWNPLKEIVSPGDTVLLKPNLVRDFRETRPGLDDCVITHGSIIRAMVDYVYIALQGVGRIVIADAPMNDADFNAIRQLAGLNAIQDFYRRNAGIEIEVYDLRPERAIKIDGVIVGHESLPGDPAGYVRVNLGPDSMFASIEPLCSRLYGSEYDTREIRSHHRGGVHEYMISRSVLMADCVISLPKLKTHKKTGITAAMKNLVGINGNKNWLPHHREGTPRQGGDQFADDSMIHGLERKVVAFFKRVFPVLGPLRRAIAGPLKAVGKKVFGDTNIDTIRSGNWHGNDTAWRMVLDLNRILRYADGEGRVHDRPVRKVLAVVDGIVGGEGNGPLDPTPKAAGVVIAGINAVAVDCISARIMGFSRKKVAMLREAFAPHRLPLVECTGEEVVMRHETADVAIDSEALAEVCDPFVPHFGWVKHIEGRLRYPC